MSIKVRAVKTFLWLRQDVHHNINNSIEQPAATETAEPEQLLQQNLLKPHTYTVLLNVLVI